MEVIAAKISYVNSKRPIKPPIGGKISVNGAMVEFTDGERNEGYYNNASGDVKATQKEIEKSSIRQPTKIQLEQKELGELNNKFSGNLSGVALIIVFAALGMMVYHH